MTDRNQRFPVPPIIGKGSTNIEALKPFVAEFNRVVEWMKAVRDVAPELRRTIDPELLRLTRVLGIECEPIESPGADDAILQHWDGMEFVDTSKPVTRANVESYDPSIPFDEDDVAPFFYNRQSGKFLPTWLRTVRHCQTCRDAGGSYPAALAAGGQRVVYPFRFTRIEFAEVAGPSSPDFTFLCDNVFDGYFLNLYCNEFDNYLPEHTDVWIYNVTGQWFAYVSSPECESESSISISESSSNSSSESSSNSSSGSSSASSSESSSKSESSQSSGSLSSSASSLSESSGGSSASSELSSGGSSESSGGSSQSTCPPCDGQQITVLTGITSDFDHDQCELTITTVDATICFPPDSGVVICP